MYCFSIFAHQGPINISKLHHKAIPIASLLWHTQMAPSFTSVHCGPVVASHLILLNTTMQYSSWCVYITLSSLQLVGLLLENGDFLNLSLNPHFTHDM